MKKTFFNIIVVSYNAGDKLIDTIESVRRQSYTGYRILVKDGMSTDGSIEKLKAKYDIGKDLILVESCDSGIYHAMNIAASYLEEKIINQRAIDQDAENTDKVKLLRAGEEPAYIFFLNCGDTFRDENVLRDVHDAIVDRNSKEGTTLPAIYYGDIFDCSTGNRIHSNPKIDDHACYRNLPSHQACFYDERLVYNNPFEAYRPGQEKVVVHAAKEIKATQTTIPFFKSNNLDYADIVGFLGEHAQTGGWILFVLMTIIVVTAVSNGANLNDGMDGMATGNSAIIGVTLGILAYVSSHIEFATYLNIMYIPGSEELVVYILAFVGALIGFLWYNAYPAQVFMGDTGSLTIGGIIAVIAIIIHKELLVPILCGVFLVENLSVILQRYFYKAGKKRGVKQRLFKRTPIHDHFRTSMDLVEQGCSVKFQKPEQLLHEAKITVRFWIVTIVLAAITIITLKIR